jgi:hypothetical protein
MATKTLTPEAFESEVQRRLIDTFELMIALDLRTRSAVWNRVERGQLPEPLIRRDRTLAFWDRDALDLPS